MRIALGMIVRSLDSDTELLRFIDNAQKHGHKLDCVIVAYALRLDPRVEQSINERVPFFPININDPGYAREEFRRRGISTKAAMALLQCPVDTSRGIVPYGFNRTAVVIEAILREIDVLFFVDSDIAPTVLVQTEVGLKTEDVDFFGAHLKYISTGAQITTSEYSGYNILPPAVFDGMEDLLEGLQKADMLDYWKSSDIHKCLAIQPPEPEIKPCTKILGGNIAIKTGAFKVLPPFFSSYYMSSGEMFLCRGEDTVLGLEIRKSRIVCTDIGLNPLHDTYYTHPHEPDLQKDPEVQRRFYYACTGWVGRNPFLNYLHDADTDQVREYQRERLVSGLGALSDYTSNPKFHSVITNFDESWGSLGRYINEYEQVLEAWQEIRKKALVF